MKRTILYTKENECMWTYDRQRRCYNTGCTGIQIDTSNYIGAYCTCCGRKIVIGHLVTSNARNYNGVYAYAN